MTYCKAINCSKERNSYHYTDYCYYHRECLDKLFKKTDDLWYDKVWEMETFETWFNGNCGYVIAYNRFSAILCSLWIVIYEPATRNMGENLVAIKCGWGFSSKSEAENKARELKRKLQSNDFHATPMLEVHPEANSYEYFSNIITSPYVIKRDMPQKWEVRYGPFLAPGQMDVKVPVDNINDYAKVFDILKVCGANCWHVGVYVGNGKVCHFSKDRNGTYIDDWEDFKKFDGLDGNIDSSKAVVYHPTIPFKYSTKIDEQIAYSVEKNFRHNNYDLYNRNCEHFANMIVYGINYSEQIANHTLTSVVSFFGREVNNGKGSTIKLAKEMEESYKKLGHKYNDLSREIERQYKQEVPPKENCRIM